MGTRYIGIIGLGVMGRNLALNIERHGFSVAGFDIDRQKTEGIQEIFSGKNVIISKSFEQFVEGIETPKKILIMVPAGKAVDTVINNLKTHLFPGDILIDGGNSFFKDTERRCKELETQEYSLSVQVSAAVRKEHYGDLP